MSFKTQPLEIQTLLFPLVVTFYKTGVQCHKQSVGIGMIHWIHSDSPVSLEWCIMCKLSPV